MPSTLSFAALTAVAAAMPRRMIMGLVLLVVVGIIVIIVLNILKAQGVSLPGVGGCRSRCCGAWVLLGAGQPGCAGHWAVHPCSALIGLLVVQPD